MKLWMFNPSADWKNLRWFVEDNFEEEKKTIRIKRRINLNRFNRTRAFMIQFSI